MTDRAKLFEAVVALADEWRKSPVVTAYSGPIAAARRPRDKGPATEFIEGLYAGAGSVAQQPLLLAHLGRPLMESGLFHLRDPGSEWWDAGHRVGEAAIITTGWYRSRIPGYPRLNVPHLAKGSALTTHEFTLRIPWRGQELGRGLQLLPEPPAIPNLLAYDSPSLHQAARSVGGELGRSQEFVNMEEARKVLTDDESRELRESVRSSEERLSPDALDAHEPSRAFARLQYREAELELAVADLSPASRRYADAFSACDSLIDDVIAVHSQLVTQGTVLRLGEITDLKLSPRRDDTEVSFKTSGENGVLHTHLASIVRVDHPLINDCVYVEGISINFAGGNESVTVNGKLIPGSGHLHS